MIPGLRPALAVHFRALDVDARRAAVRLLARAQLAIVGEAWEGRESERHVVLGAGDDEHGGKGVDGHWVKRGLEWICHWDFADSQALH